jgi:uncharacterized protein (TIGR02145 family)
MKMLTTSFLIMISVTIYAQIENVDFKIQENKIIVSFDLLCKETYYTELYYTKDGGDTWHGPLKNIQGDINEVTAGKNKSIIFDFREEVPWLIAKHLRFKIKLIQAKGNFTDSRDGQVYKWVKIGKQTWMVEDLRATGYTDGTPILIEHEDKWDELSVSDKACRSRYEDIFTNTPKYYLLYTWAAASKGEVSYSNPSGVQGICPDGWHLPSLDEWKQLSAFNKEYPYYKNGLSKEINFLLLPEGKPSIIATYWGGGAWWNAEYMGITKINVGGNSNEYNFFCYRILGVKDLPVRCIKD